MKRKYGKILCLALTAVITAFSACSDRSAGNDPGGSADRTEDTGIVYRGRRYGMPEDIHGETDSRNDVGYVYHGGRLYFMTSEGVGAKNEEGGFDAFNVYLNSVDAEGGGLQSALIAEGDVTVSNPVFLSDGSAAYIKTVFGGDMPQYFLVSSAPDGSGETSTDISEVIYSYSDMFYVYGIAADSSDNICINGYTYIIVTDRWGKGIFGADAGYCQKIVNSANGDMYVHSYSGNGYETKKIDVQAKTLGEDVSLSDDSYGNYNTHPFSGGGDVDMYVDNSDFLFALDLETGEQTPVLQWVDSDLARMEIDDILSDGNGGFICPGKSFPSENPIITAVTPRNASDIPRKTELIMAGGPYDIDAFTEYQAVKFNMENENYRIKVKKYSGDNYMSGLNSDILSGNIPDILVTNSQTNMESYASKGLFLDLYPLIDNDPDLDRGDLLGNVLKAFETDGKLLRLTDCFMVYTVIGKTSVFGGDTSMDFDKLNSVMAKFPQGTDSFAASTKNDILEYGMNMTADEFIDFKKGECYFTSDYFIGLLEFANNFIDSVEYENYFDDAFWQRFDTMFSDDEALLMIAVLSDYSDIYRFERVNFKEKVTAMGFPSFSGGSGSSIYFDRAFAISAKSENSGAAWEFVRSLFMPDYQDCLSCFPVRRSSLDKLAEKAMEHDEDRINNGLVIMGQMMLSSGVSDIGEPSREDIDRVNGIITSVNTLQRYNNTVIDIINEEASMYFSGARSAREAAEMIQSRVQIYLDESR
ncbi:MAG: ABC transporter substrate-binding protein [Ruminococcus sp.]|nr:ABC transporter substrate-binding protein [Ruminococcus sp.]